MIQQLFSDLYLVKIFRYDLGSIKKFIGLRNSNSCNFVKNLRNLNLNLKRVLKLKIFTFERFFLYKTVFFLIFLRFIVTAQHFNFNSLLNKKVIKAKNWRHVVDGKVVINFPHFSMACVAILSREDAGYRTLG